MHRHENSDKVRWQNFILKDTSFPETQPNTNVAGLIVIVIIWRLTYDVHGFDYPEIDGTLHRYDFLSVNKKFCLFY